MTSTTNNPTTHPQAHNPFRVTDIQFAGVKRTSSKILARIVADVYQATSKAELDQRVVIAAEKLGSLGAFESVQAKLANQVNSEEYEVIFEVAEQKLITGGARTEFGDKSSNLSFQLAFPNINGLGDSIEFNSSFSRRSYSGECSYSVPLLPWKNFWNPNYYLSYSQYQVSSLPSGFDQEDKSIVNRIDFYSSPELFHSISFKNIWRFLKSSNINTPIQIREQCGHSIRSSIEHCMSWDKRLFLGGFPVSGCLAKFTNEFVASLVKGGANLHTRHETHLQWNTHIIPDLGIIGQASLLAGTIFGQKPDISDMLFAGGPMTVRGFEHQGIGPSARGYPLGGLSYLAASVHLYSNMPYISQDSQVNQFLRPHIFLNVGSIGKFKLPRSKDDYIRFRDNLRLSYGFGLVLETSIVRLELNNCFPIIFMDGDRYRKGLQWGFGRSYS